MNVLVMQAMYSIAKHIEFLLFTEVRIGKLLDTKIRVNWEVLKLSCNKVTNVCMKLANGLFWIQSVHCTIAISCSDRQIEMNICICIRWYIVKYMWYLLYFIRQMSICHLYIAVWYAMTNKIKIFMLKVLRISWLKILTIYKDIVCSLALTFSFRK